MGEDFTKDTAGDETEADQKRESSSNPVTDVGASETAKELTDRADRIESS